MKVQNYVFGYGSLICPHSRAVTAPSSAMKEAVPVVVHGLERIFSKRTQRGMTAMGVRFQDDAECVGVLVPVTEDELEKFDVREQGYDRKALSIEQVDLVPFLNPIEYYDNEDAFLNAKQLNRSDDVQLWVYVQQQPLPPTSEHPIVQSYVDTILRGCLSISEEFAREFISTTKGWHPDEIPDLVDESSGDESEDDEESGLWVDDRHDPVYVRGDPHHSRKHSKEFDKLIKTVRPHHLATRKSR